MLTDDGIVFLVDESAHDLWAEEAAPLDEPNHPADPDDPDSAADREVVIRTLTDGRRFRIIKVLWDPPELSARLAGLGWQATFTREDPFFWGTVRRASAR